MVIGSAGRRPFDMAFAWLLVLVIIASSCDRVQCQTGFVCESELQQIDDDNGKMCAPVHSNLSITRQTRQRLVRAVSVQP